MDNKEIIIEQYRVFTDTISGVSSQRATANQFYITINLGLLASIPVLIDKFSQQGLSKLYIFAIGFVGVALNIIWVITLITYKQLNSAKFKALKEMENLLPVRPFEREWEVLRPKREQNQYLTLTGAEKVLPMIMIIPHVVMMLYMLQPTHRQVTNQRCQMLNQTIEQGFGFR